MWIVDRSWFLGFFLTLFITTQGLADLAADIRAWQLDDGTRLEARYVGMVNQVVRLQETNGLVRAVWFGQLSEADRNHLFPELAEDQQAAVRALVPALQTTAESARRAAVRQRLDAMRSAGRISAEEYNAALGEMYEARPAEPEK